jgi:hypothetical protein
LRGNRGAAGKHPAQTKSPGADLLRPPTVTGVRSLVERFFSKIRQCRRVAARYDKPAVNYLAFVKLASIRLRLRAYESTPELLQKYVNQFQPMFLNMVSVIPPGLRIVSARLMTGVISEFGLPAG